MRIHVLLACHDRRALTVRALRSMRASLDRAGIEAAFTLFDDGSVDGTAEAVAELPFAVEVVHGDGDAFWARGMSLAERAADARGPRDAVVWLNDDVDVDLDAMERLVALAEQHPDAVLVGSVREDDGAVSYSGYRRAGRHPLRLRQVDPGEAPTDLDTFNGNLLLVPEGVRRVVGSIDGGFAHQLADIDYGFRVRDAGRRVLLAPGTYGTCPTNPPPRPRPLLAEWRAFRSPKGGGHPASMRRFLRRRAPVAWPVWVAQTAVLWWVRALLRRVRLSRASTQ